MSIAPRNRSGRFFVVAASAWLIAIALSGLLDAPVARLVRASGVDELLRTHRWLAEIIKAPGEFVVTIIIAIVAGLVHAQRLRAGLFVFSSCAASIINRPLQWIIGRIRPFKIENAPHQLDPWYLQPFRGGIEGLRIAKNLCFPSGHATLTFATAAALGMLWPRWRWLWYSIAVVVAIERVLENAHWLSDCVAGAALGIGGVYLVAFLLKSWKIDRPTDSPTSRS